MTTKHNIKFHSGIVRDPIVDYLAKHPGSTSIAVSEALGLTPKAATAALGNMHKAGITTRRRAGKCYAYMLKAEEDTSPQISYADRIASLERKVADRDATIRRLRTNEEVMMNEIEQLAAFKEKAIAKYPALIPINYDDYREAFDRYNEARGYDCPPRAGCTIPLQEWETAIIDGIIAASAALPKKEK